MEPKEIEMRNCPGCRDPDRVHVYGIHACYWWERGGRNDGLDALTAREAHALADWFEGMV